MTAQKDARNLLTRSGCSTIICTCRDVTADNQGAHNMVTIIIWAIALTPLAIPVSNWWCNRGLRR
jgi:hypothetical protein